VVHGKSTNVERRYEQHQAGTACEWTRHFPPIRIAVQTPMVNAFHESNLTLEYMCRYGIDNVRGANYTQPVLSEEQMDLIQGSIWNHLDLCIGCGLPDHMINQCPYTDCDDDDDEDAAVNGRVVICYECRQPGHYRNQCPLLRR
jgi:hypothetical protein